MTVRISGTNTTAAPGFQGGDSDTGIRPGTNEIEFVTGGSVAATFNSSGNLVFQILKVLTSLPHLILRVVVLPLFLMIMRRAHLHQLLKLLVLNLHTPLNKDFTQKLATWFIYGLI